MDLWAPNLNPGFDFKNLELTQEEAFILYQLDGTTTVQNLVHLSGLPKNRVREILLKLHLAGALSSEGLPDDITREARLVTEGLVETDAPFVVDALEEEPDIAFEDEGEFSKKLVTEEQLAANELALLREDDAIQRGEVRELDSARRFADAEQGDGSALFREVTSEDLNGDALSQARSQAAPVQAPPAQTVSAAMVHPEDFGDARKQRLARLRKIFKAKFASMPAGPRLKLAREAEGDELSALCFDPSPEVTHAVLQNPNLSVVHGRLLASQAHNPLVLDHLAEHPMFSPDPHVRRYLLGNKRGTDTLYLRLFEQMSMGEIVELGLGEELSKRSKRNGLQTLRKLYQRASAPERLALVLDTDGACLHAPFSLNLDTKTGTLLVETEITSSGLANNLANCRSTPTNVIRHLLHSALTRSSPPLRSLLQQHPNARR